MEKNKYTLWTIIILLVLILPFTCYGTYKHIVNNVNFKRQFKYNGKLWFYDGKKLIGTYSCQSKECDYATYRNNSKSNIINNNYAFISDNEKVYLYNIKNDIVIKEYDAVNSGDEGNYYVMILQGEKEIWGAIQITPTSIVNKIEPKYDDIYYLNGKYVVTENNNQKIIDGEDINNKKVLFVTSYKIKDFNDKYIIVSYESSSCPTCTNVIETEKLYDYDNNSYFSNREAIEEISFVSEYIMLKTNHNYYIYSILDNEERFISSFYYDGADKITYNVDESGNISFYANTKLLKTIEIENEE